ncbi:diacylglycerol/lipid kinase family protein [Hyphococcus lacteus]|uniref:Diacylglycerol kinase family protein n=1 Tax=Hyphococcus lacteus TaxID=3143536 RepID=A0ABV3Z3M6_9PROT
MKNALVLINECSGAVSTLGVKECISGLSEHISDIAHITVANGHPRILIEKAKKAIETGNTEYIIVLGGDGTLAAIAGIVAGHNVKLVPLPGGTMNAFSRDLGYNADLRTAIAQIPTLKERAVDLAFANEFAFLNNIVFGTYTAVADSREQLRDAEGIFETIDSVTEIIGSLTHTTVEQYRLHIDGQERVAETNTIMAANNVYEGAEALRPIRSSLDKGVIGLYVASSSSALDFITTLSDAVTGNLANSELIDFRECEKLSVSTDSGYLSVTIDGEAMELPSPINVETRQKALRVLAP